MKLGAMIKESYLGWVGGPLSYQQGSFKRNLQKERFDHTHKFHELQFMSLIQKAGVQSTVFKNQIYNITILNYIYVHLSSARLSFKEKQTLQSKSGDNIK